MSIDLRVSVNAVELEVDDEIDLENDELCHNEDAVYGYAHIFDIKEWYDSDDQLCLTITTSQGIYDVPAYHIMWLRVKD